MTDWIASVDDLLDHHAADDPVVIESILRAYHNSIHRLALSILEDAAEAEDAVQETFIQAALNLDRYRTGTNFRAWLYTIALNICRGTLRKREVRQRLQSLLSNLPQSIWPLSYPEEQLIEAEAHVQLRFALQKLDEKHRLPVLLRFVHDLPIVEIAQILGVREGTVHSRLHYGIKKLRGYMDMAGAQIASRQNAGKE